VRSLFQIDYSTLWRSQLLSGYLAYDQGMKKVGYIFLLFFLIAFAVILFLFFWQHFRKSPAQETKQTTDGLVLSVKDEHPDPAVLLSMLPIPKVMISQPIVSSPTPTATLIPNSNLTQEQYPAQERDQSAPVTSLEITSTEGATKKVIKPRVFSVQSNQEFLLEPGVEYLSFSYMLTTTEYQPFGEPIWTVNVNDVPLTQAWANDVNRAHDESGSQHSTDWIKQTFLIPPMSDVPTKVVFQLHDHTDTNIYNSSVQLKDVSNDLIYLRPGETLHFQIDNEPTTTKTYYQLGVGQVKQGSSLTSTELSLAEESLRYWSVDSAGNVEVPQMIRVRVDQTAPAAISDLRAVRLEGNTVQLSFSAPDDEFEPSVSGYEFRYSREPITPDTNWSELPALVSNQTAPRWSTQSEVFFLTLPASEPSQLYIAAKSRDVIGNWSLLSNVVRLE
jgi:hypothetical protein